MTEYENGELFVYVNGDRWELGVVKCPGNGNGYFCWYSRGDTAAFTPTSCMHKLANAGYSHIERPTAMHMIVNHGVTGHSACTGCGKAIDPWDCYCRCCGSKLEGGWKL